MSETNAEQKTADFADGDKCVIEAKRKRNLKLWGHYNGRECFIVSRHRDAAIVEIPSLKEMIICRTKDLRPVQTKE